MKWVRVKGWQSFVDFSGLGTILWRRQSINAQRTIMAIIRNIKQWYHSFTKCNSSFVLSTNFPSFRVLLGRRAHRRRHHLARQLQYPLHSRRVSLGRR